MKDYTIQIQNNYKSHEVDNQQGYNMSEIRIECQQLAYTLDRLIPDSREKSIALTKLEEVMFWANAGIARGD